jgi:hypothetical protein
MIASADGVTASERYLMRLVRKSFLSLWSFPNLYRNSGRAEGKGDGQELTDVLVLFNEHVIVFSDKHSAYPKHADARVAWARWYRYAVEKSAKQLVGARNWIRFYPDRVFLDKGCTQVLPLSFPRPDVAKFHLVAVTRGAHDACRSHFNNQSIGSLIVDMTVEGKDHYNEPFRIGRVLPEPFIHVLDEVSLEVLLRELDTVTDFVRYLGKREQFLSRTMPQIIASGEEQLTAIYLTNLNDEGRHDFALPEKDIDGSLNVAYFGEGFWEELVRNPQYLAKKAADRISYAWDNLIEHFVKLSNPASMKESEQALRLLASESRFSRRYLSEQLLGALSKEVRDGERFARCGNSADDPSRCYVYLIFPRPSFVKTYQEYREGRRSLLHAYCCVAKLLMPEARVMIGIATEPRWTKGASEDLLAIDVGPESWGEERAQEARDTQAQLGIFLENSTVKYRGNSREFPHVPAAAKRDLSPAGRLRERERLRNIERVKKRQFTKKNRDLSRP